MKSFIKRFMKNEKGFALIQAIGIASIAIVLVSSVYRATNDGVTGWLGSIDNGMDNILAQSSLTGGSGGSGGSGGGGGTLPPAEPEVNTPLHFDEKYSASMSGMNMSIIFSADGGVKMYQNGELGNEMPDGTLTYDGTNILMGEDVFCTVASDGTYVETGGVKLYLEGVGNAIPEGSYFFNINIETGDIVIYDTMPSIPSQGDMYLNGDYMYGYGSEGGVAGTPGWDVSLASEDNYIAAELMTVFPEFDWTDNNQTTYGPILENICGEPIVALYETFWGCTLLTTAPEIPNSVTTLSNAFADCRALEKAPVIPSSVIDMQNTFSECTSLADISDLVIPENVQSIEDTFKGCTSLTGEIEINANNLSTYDGCFEDTINPIKITGTTPYKAELAATANNGNVTY